MHCLPGRSAPLQPLTRRGPSDISPLPSLSQFSTIPLPLSERTQTVPSKKSRPSGHQRRTLFDSLPTNETDNLYCAAADLTNEASVENFFVDRMVKDLGYRDAQIKLKESIENLTVSLGGQSPRSSNPTMQSNFGARHAGSSTPRHRRKVSISGSFNAADTASG